ncbi:cyclin-A2-1-like isoform X2 [Silene latifolia]|uniref:cyclin-A2-1-like isoform X2 n=1 Tax=Silene latifolia TaxID=37657 RepID=UPI003D76B290
MNKENIADIKVGAPPLRITRARAKALGTLRGQVQKPPRPEPSRFLRANSKRVASDDNKIAAPTGSLWKKSKATLADVTNVLCEQSHVACFNVGRFQNSKQLKKGPTKKNVKVTPTVPKGMLNHQDDVKERIAEDVSKLTVKPQHVNSSYIAIIPGENHGEHKFQENVQLQPISECTREQQVVPGPLQKGEKNENARDSNNLSIIDIDFNQKDPLMCGLYASDIYEHKRVTELNQRPSYGYMENMQRDVTPSMRGILVDWLIEVSEEYKLVPDTLYLTVNLIDRYLSRNYMEKQKLQLLGVTCMLIASKYEEMCAPQVEDFCYITANTYSKEEVLLMERKVLNFLCFQLSVPTIKTFLRRYIYAAQATYKAPSVELEFLANYLAELTLVEYSFLKFLPSLISASAVFLARWTLDQSAHPWNPTLEHYTGYKTNELKVTVTAMQDLQLNVSKSTLNAIREKYRNEKFNGVANMSTPESVQCLF